MKKQLIVITIDQVKAIKSFNEFWEKEQCNRCAGIGEYSFNLMYGKVCFKCGGAKQVLTRKGKKQQAKFHELTFKPFSEIQVGDRVCFNPGWGTVTEVITNANGSMTVRSAKNGLTANPEHKLSFRDNYENLTAAANIAANV
jgi:RecJ-like exonuclease